MTEWAPRSVRRCGLPAYPTKLEILADPALLSEHVPPAWLSRQELSGALAAFLAVNTSGCLDDPAGQAVVKQPPKHAVVAPIFEHGEGRGSVGCVAVSPPVFLSEEEAVAVIREELSLRGLAVSQTDVELPQVMIRGTVQERRYNWLTDRNEWGRRHVSEPLKVDLKDRETGVAVEYVNWREYERLGGEFTGRGSVSGYNVKDVAESVARQVRKKGAGVYFGAFYDPVVRADRSKLFHAWKDEEDYRARLQAARDEAAVESKRLLRQQVKDFVDWLKGQGVI